MNAVVETSGDVLSGKKKLKAAIKDTLKTSGKALAQSSGEVIKRKVKGGRRNNFVQRKNPQGKKVLLRDTIFG